MKDFPTIVIISVFLIVYDKLMATFFLTNESLNSARKNVSENRWTLNAIFLTD